MDIICVGDGITVDPFRLVCGEITLAACAETHMRGVLHYAETANFVSQSRNLVLLMLTLTWSQNQTFRYQTEEVYRKSFYIERRFLFPSSLQKKRKTRPML